MKSKEGKIGFKVGIVLFLVVILLAAIAFTILINLKNKTNVAEIINQCEISCSGMSVYGYCDVQRTLIDPNLPNDELSKKASCDFFSTNGAYAKYGIENCPDIQPCDVAKQPDKTFITGLSGTWQTPDTQDNCPLQDGKEGKQRIPSDNSPLSNQICCYYKK